MQDIFDDNIGIVKYIADRYSEIHTLTGSNDIIQFYNVIWIQLAFWYGDTYIRTF